MPAPAAELRFDRFVSSMVTKIFPKAQKKSKKARPAKSNSRKSRKQPSAVAGVLPENAPLPTAAPGRIVLAVPAVLTNEPVVLPPEPAILRADPPVEAVEPPVAEAPVVDNPVAEAPAVEEPNEAPVMAYAPIPAPVVLKPVRALPALKPVPPALLEQPIEEIEPEAAESQPTTNPEEVILASIPIPQWRPEIAEGTLPKKRDPYVDPATGTRATSPAEEFACRVQLQELGVEYKELGFIGDPDGCAVTNPISVTSFGAGIDIKPGTTMNCAMAAATATFAQQTLAASAKSAFGSELATIEHASAYMCRPRHGLQKLSEHAFGNALDITAFRLKDGRRIEVRATDVVAEAEFLDSVRSAACGPFKTVLGPGNADHETHFHFDLQPRKRGGAYCPGGSSVIATAPQ